MNRAEKGWTVPYARGMSPYNKIYIASEKGVFLYDWKNHSLKQISSKDIRGTVARQPAVGKAPMIAIIVSDGQALTGIAPEFARDWAYIASGAMTQNMYLAAASMDIGTRYIVQMNTDVIRKELQMGPSDLPLCIMPFGKN
jgi:nitroreductase